MLENLWRGVSNTRNILVACLLMNLWLCCDSYLVDNNPYRHVETLDGEGKYILEWMVDWETKRVIFNVTAETTGYIGFGLSRRGKMTGADIIIGGVGSDGKPYFTDRHAIGNQLPALDDIQDWTLHGAWENGDSTFLSFSRAFDTCDKEDYPITEDVISLIWSFGENDNMEEYHFHNRGHFDAFLLDPDLTPKVAQPHYRAKNPKELGDLKVWTVNKLEMLPPKETFYTCSFHKAPRFKNKQHIIGFNTNLHSPLEQRFLMRITVYRCYPPAGRDAAAFFERYVRNRGSECYTHKSAAEKIPTMNCREPVHLWSNGGKSLFLPEHVGIPFSMEANEYFMIQAHYHNSEAIPGVRLRYALEVFYTGNTRKHDAGVMMIGHKVPGTPSLLMPPSSLGHLIYGHCGIDCTTQMISERNGIQIFGASMHTNSAGRGVRLLHLRGNQELPWISYDDNYSYKFQQSRILRKERTVLPGDQLITRCAYETTGKRHVTIGGVSMRNEICVGMIWYYNRIPGYGICNSEISSEAYLGRLGIMNATWSDQHLESIITSPPSFAGLSVSEVCSRHIKWNIARRYKLQEDHRYLPQLNQCPRLIPEKEKGKKAVRVTTTTRRPANSLSRYTPGRNDNKKQIDLSDDKSAEDWEDYIQEEFETIFAKNVIPYERDPTCANTKQMIQTMTQYNQNPLSEAEGYPKETWWSINSKIPVYSAA